MWRSMGQRFGRNVLDRELRVVKTFYGFGSTIDPIKEIVRAEVASADLLETDR